MYIQTLYAGWGDMDYNAHMRNTAYLDKSGDVRMMYFAENGFSMTEFTRLRIGPVVMKDEVEYFREIGLMHQFKVGLMAAGLSADGSRFRIRNVFMRDDDKVVATVTSTGGWLDLNARKLIVPPQGLLLAMQQLTRSDDFADLPGSIRDKP